jgi:hypothetical protein
MSEAKFSIEFLATSLVTKLNRRNIFPPLFNNPELFVSPVGPRLKKPPNSFLICRRNVYKEANRKGIHNMRVISKAASILWNKASSKEKKIYERIADHVHEIYTLRNSSSLKLMFSSPRDPLNLSLSPSPPLHL